MSLLSLVMDFVLLLALAGGMYYMMRLSRSLDNFREHREALKAVIVELGRNIDEAHRAIDELRKSSNTAADNLEDVLHDSRKMVDELKMINATGDGLASRLEKLAERARKAAQGRFEDDYDSAPSHEKTEEPYRPAHRGNVDAPAFSIQDRDVSLPEEDDWAQAPEEFSSQAERDLYNALKKNKKITGGGHF
ncbi:MAG: hypothetical protein IT559_06175 [Alphaproteobacteria bacterium]|nr:hypothetical protein [Alphaproteobacteria bacterium]